MTDHFAQTNGVRASTVLPSAEVTFAEMVARGAYCFVSWVERMYRRWREHRQAVKALNHLRQLDDRHLADMGLRRDDLTVAGLETASTRRNAAYFTVGQA